MGVRFYGRPFVARGADWKPAGAGSRQGMVETPQDPKTAPAEALEGTNAQKDPDQWVTGEEPMTGAQASYLRTLSEEAGEELDTTLTKAEASKRIDELQERTGRGG